MQAIGKKIKAIQSKYKPKMKNNEQTMHLPKRHPENNW